LTLQNVATIYDSYVTHDSCVTHYVLINLWPDDSPRSNWPLTPLCMTGGGELPVYLLLGAFLLSMLAKVWPKVCLWTEPAFDFNLPSILRSFRYLPSKWSFNFLPLFVLGRLAFDHSMDPGDTKTCWKKICTSIPTGISDPAACDSRSNKETSQDCCLALIDTLPYSTLKRGVVGWEGNGRTGFNSLHVMQGSVRQCA